MAWTFWRERCSCFLVGELVWFGRECGRGVRGAHIALEDVSCGTAGEVVGGDLDHDLVEILDNIFKLACGLSLLWLSRKELGRLPSMTC